MFNDRECWHKLCVLGDMGDEFENMAIRSTGLHKSFP